jgi:hypothetical protein
VDICHYLIEITFKACCLLTCPFPQDVHTVLNQKGGGVEIIKNFL